MDVDSHSDVTTRSGSSGGYTGSTGTRSSKASGSTRGSRIRRVIHALSFERLPARRSGNGKKSPKSKRNAPKDVLVPADAMPNAARTPVVSNTGSYQHEGGVSGLEETASHKDDSISESSSVLDQLVVQVSNDVKPSVVTGTLLENSDDDDSDNVEVVFYDAQQEGDGDHEDDFRTTGPARDSILLDNIVAVRGGQGDHADSIELTTDAQEAKKSVSLARPPSPPPLIRRDPTWVEPPSAPPAPKNLPLRFLRAGKGDPVEGARRYQATLQWRKENEIDGILREPNPYFEVIKKNYPHFCHGKGYHGEPCYYEQPPKTNLKAMREGGVDLERLLRHYAMVTEFQWQYLVRDDLTRSIYIIDLQGMRFTDFVGDVVDFVKRASALSSQHYPERAGVVFVINVPGWFKMIWNVVKPWVDEVTLKKIFILRDKEEIRRCMEEKIPPENLPQEYGGKSPYPLGQSPEEVEFAALVAHNNKVVLEGDCSCGGAAAGSTCRFCTWTPPRSY